MKKTIKFIPRLAELILGGNKTSTWRLYDDKGLMAGDLVDFLNSETKERFGEAVLTSVVEKRFGAVAREDFDGHEPYASNEEMYEAFRKYYGEKVGPDSPLKVIKFTFIPVVK